MNINAWNDQLYAVKLRLANEKDELVTLIKTFVNDALAKEGFDNRVKIYGTEFCLGLNELEGQIVAWSNDLMIELSNLSYEKLLDIASKLSVGVDHGIVKIC